MHFPSSRFSFFCAAVCAAAVSASVAQASPVINISLVARLDGTTNAWSSTITSPTLNQVYDYEVVYTILGGSNLSNTHLTTTIAGFRTSRPDSLTAGDGMVTQTYTINQATTDASQVTFQFTGAGTPSALLTAYTHYGSVASGSRKPRANGTNGLVSNNVYDAFDHRSSNGTSINGLGTVISPAFAVPDSWLIDDGTGTNTLTPAGSINYSGTGLSGGTGVDRGNGNQDLGNSTTNNGAAVISGTLGITGTNTPTANMPLGNGMFQIMTVGSGNTTSTIAPQWKGFGATSILGIFRYLDSTNTQVIKTVNGSDQFNYDGGGNQTGTTTDPIYTVTPLTIVTVGAGGGSPGSYTLSATPTTVSLMKGDSTAITSTIKNNGVNGTNDNVQFSNLGWSGLTGPNTITNLGGTTSGTLNTPDSVGATATGTFNANAYGTQVLTSSVSTTAGANGQPVLSGTAGQISINVGVATPAIGGTSNGGLTTFGAAITSSTLSGGTNYGSGSQTAKFGTKSNGTTNGSLGTTAELLDGQTGGTRTISMAWRTRATSEIPGSVTTPPGPHYGVVSDVVQLTGLALNGSTSTDPTQHVQADKFVLQMSVSDAAFGGSHAALQTAIANGFLYLGWLDDTAATTSANGGLPLWRNAVHGDFANFTPNPDNLTGYVGSYAQYYADTQGVGHIAKTANTNRIGDWGVQDLGNGNGAFVWAVLDHNSIFAAVPEPSSIVMFGCGLLGLVTFVRRRRTATTA